MSERGRLTVHLSLRPRLSYVFKWIDYNLFAVSVMGRAVIRADAPNITDNLKFSSHGRVRICTQMGLMGKR